jgi:hypothetical protein
MAVGHAHRNRTTIAPAREGEEALVPSAFAPHSKAKQVSFLTGYSLFAVRCALNRRRNHRRWSDGIAPANRARANTR